MERPLARRLRRRQLFDRHARIEHLVHERELFPVHHWIELQRRRAGSRLELSDSEVKAAPGPPNDDAARGFRIAGGQLRVSLWPQVAEPDIVGVGIENDETEVRLDEEPLEHEPERVGLSRARLATEEGVAIEPAGIERRRNARREEELADRGGGPGGLTRRQPLGDIRRISRSHECIVERSRIAVEDDARAAGEPECDPRSQLAWPIAAHDL